MKRKPITQVKVYKKVVTELDGMAQGEPGKNIKRKTHGT